MKIFLTGGSGFVGTYAIRKMISEGHEVLALARSKSAANKVESLGAKSVLGDFDDMTWAGTLKGCDVVIHSAAPFELWGPWERFEQAIVHATIDLAKSAAAHNVKRFIHISSEAAIQGLGDLVDVDEDVPCPHWPNSFYGKAKLIAELRLSEANLPMDIVILRPPFVWGSDSFNLDDIAMRAKSGSFIWLSGGKSLFESVHVENLAHAIFLAATHPNIASGVSTYFVTDDRAKPAKEFFSRFFIERNIRVPRKSVAGGFIRVIAQALEQIWTFFGIKSKPPVTVFEWAFLAQPRRYNIKRIKDELGYHPIEM